MPCTRKKKNRTRRGNVSCGHGRIGKHRKHAAGRGNAGGQHHHRIWFDKFHPGYFGKVGMRQFHLNKDKNWRPCVNLDELWQLAGEKKYKDAKDRLEKKDNKVQVIDVLNHGKAKVLGRGRLPNVPLIVRARYFSKIAEHKIRKAGGICQLRA